ncbi:uncharacterized protein N7479_011117 [Penicillium vulpinum]|uniref:Uncharacterized protein n=1 Tax=Penicillium vulpinum TaxID=29845 RepID=A0A1V6RTZ3_9EURO|nr:uncharacterized protein N7479_011117 [Penicillium vulpinum]KAJ5952704.1 hypothetical protein N7479_011117 [Penicillium vulpinum]OQE04883.1 hypothetical protein PENVUL_c029G05773 [Penicillium vulpinum]
MASSEYPPYVPMPSLRHELGLMFGFISLCIVVMGAYVTLWRINQARLHAQDLSRRRALNKSPTQAPLGTTTSVTAGRSPSPDKDTLTPKATVQEKMFDRIGMPENRAELPVHGMEMYALGKKTPFIKCPFSRATPFSPISPISLLGSGVGVGRAVGSVSPIGSGIALDSIVRVAMDGGRSLGQDALRVDGFPSASPARRFGGGSSPAVEIGPAPSRE